MSGQHDAPVRVLLDATSIPPDEGGVARYLRGLIEGLSAHRQDVLLHVVCKRTDAAWVRAAHDGAVVHIGPATLAKPALRLLWEQCGMPLLARRIRADVIHSPHYTMPLFSGVPTVVTVHDATFFSMPKLHSRLKGMFFRAWCRISARTATIIVGPSEATREEFREHAGTLRAPFRIAYHGVAHDRFHPPTANDVSAFVERHAVQPRRWIAFLGMIEPRKNVPNLIRAFEQLLKDGSPATRDLCLLLAGGPGWDDTVDTLIANSPARSRIRRMGYLAEDELRAFLGGSLCVAYPSLGEGFGLPVLEAMACGATVLTTRMLALPEVGGDAVFYTGTSPESIASGLLELTMNDSLRHELAAKAVLRAASFTWEKSAHVHIGAYLFAAGRRGDEHEPGNPG